MNRPARATSPGGLLTNIRQGFQRLQRYAPRASTSDALGIPIKLLILAVVLGLAVVSMAWLGSLATLEWRRSATMVMERRVTEVDAVLTTALTRDMRGAQASILMPLEAEQIILDPPHELSDIVARAFARFPYPESFFAWRSRAPSFSAVLFNRTERPPAWDESNADESLFPVTSIRDSALAHRLASLARDGALGFEQLALLETTIGGSPYHVVARLFRDRDSKREVHTIVGFTINLDWVKTTYFSELTSQIDRINGSDESGSLSLSIADENNRIVTQTRPPSGAGPLRERHFTLAFFDTSTVPTSALRNMSLHRWAARVTTADDALIGAADRGANRTFMLILSAAGLSFLGLILAMYSLRANLEVAAMKADFVAMVSHELKTPLAGISLVGETLSKGRYASAQVISDYGELLSKEASRLKKLVENVLTFSRVTGSQNHYEMVHVNPGELITEALARLQPLIGEGSFAVRCDISNQVPEVNCDREEVIRVFENLIENAIKYSDKVKDIHIRVSGNTTHASISIKDSGKGIMPEDLPYVFDRFFRGRNAGFQGSGLGLAIAHKVIKDHDGNISINSQAGKGTLITVTLPSVKVTS